MKVTTKLFSVLLLLSISLVGCKAVQAPQEEPVARSAQQPSVAGAVHIQSADQFNQLVNQGNVVVDFYAEWCGPCKMLGPVIEEFAREIPAVTFLKVNVDQFRSLAGAYGVRKMPTLILLQNGNQVHRITGYNGNKPALLAEFTRVFSLNTPPA